jgi:hypothetical protein
MILISGNHYCHVRWVPVTTAWHGLQIWKVTAWGLGMGLTTLHHKKYICYKKSNRALNLYGYEIWHIEYKEFV